MDTRYLQVAKETTRSWREYFKENDLTGQAPTLSSLKMVVDYATFLEDEVERRDARFAWNTDPGEAPLVTHSRAGWWDRFMDIFRSP
jgi:hypothetical protein